MRLSVVLKAVFRRPFTYADLNAAANPFIAHPPLPAEWYDFAATLVGKSGVSLLDYWRRQFQTELQQVSQEPTWARQRAVLLRIVLSRSSWLATYSASRQARHSASWAHLVEGHDAFAHLDDEDDRRPLMLLQIWLVALLSAVSLRGVGQQLFDIDRLKQLEIDAHEAYDREIKQLDVSCMDLILDRVSEGHADDAHAIAEFKDNQVNPIIHDQYAILHRMAEDIINSSLDVDRVKQQIADVQSKKEVLAEVVRGSSTDLA